MTQTHTPGPWTTEDQMVYGNGEEIAEVYGNSQGHAEANARLIAKAPEMRSLLVLAARLDDLLALDDHTRLIECQTVAKHARALLATIDGKEVTR